MNYFFWKKCRLGVCALVAFLCLPASGGTAGERDVSVERSEILSALTAGRTYRHNGLEYAWRDGRVVLAAGGGVKGIDKIVEANTAPRWDHELKPGAGGCVLGADSVSALTTLGGVLRDELSRRSVEILFVKRTGLEAACEEKLLRHAKAVVSSAGMEAERLKIGTNRFSKWGKGLTLRFLILP